LLTVTALVDNRSARNHRLQFRRWRIVLPPSRRIKNKMKFSIRALLAVTALIALLAAIYFVFPPIVAAISLMLLIPTLSSAIVSGAYYGTGDLRAFCIGVLGVIVPAAGFFVGILFLDVGFGLLDDPKLTNGDWEDISGFSKIFAALILLPSLPAGLTGVVVRRLLVSGPAESRSATLD
jgi:hypothetical protein